MDIDLDLFDAIVFHYSIVISRKSYLPRAFAKRLAAHRGPKLLFIQDEYRWVDKTSDAIRQLGIDVVFTVVNPDVVRQIYRDPRLNNVRFEHTLTGFVPEQFLHRAVPDYVDRPIDVSYRARKLPAWYGSFADQKWQIGDRFLKDAERFGLRCDIAMSESSRIYGEAWINFMARSKAVLGTESGASYVDYSGEVQSAAEAYAEAHPAASHDEIRRRFLDGRDGNVTIRVISPRCFEAAALRTLMIMYPGEYSGILTPGRHYVLLERDHSNIEEVVRTLRDPERAGDIIDNAYKEIACSGRWSFTSMVNHFDTVIADSMHLANESTGTACAATRVRDRNGSVEAELASLLKAHRRRKWILSARYRAALRLQRAATVVRTILENYLPPFLSRPLLASARAVKRRCKPVLRRMLLQ